MAKEIILTDTDTNQVEKLADVHIQDENWEENCYQLGCCVAKEVAARYLESKAEELDKQRPDGYRVKNTNPRTLVTRFGDITFRRRLYQDRQGECHFLLDKHLNLKPNQVATPSLTEALVDTATKLSFRKTAEEVHKYTAGVLGASTVHRLLQRVTQDVIQEEKMEWEACFKRGVIPLPGKRKVDMLYTEPDGLVVHLQQENQKHYELKGAITYEGWERIPGTSADTERYRLVNKKVYSHGDDSIPFWEGIGIHWNEYWDMRYVKRIVLGGDDANWIDEGTDELGSLCIRQLSGFHLSRACRKGWEDGGDMYDAIRSGRVRSTPGELKEREGKAASKSRNYVLNRLDKGVDWRKKADFQIPAEALARGLGGIEGNEAHLFADRMKDRGMSWSIAGAVHMGKAIQLAFNGELERWCGRKPLDSVNSGVTLSFDLFDELGGYGKRTGLPALEGPHASRPWVRVLKDITSTYNPLN